MKFEPAKVKALRMVLETMPDQAEVWIKTTSVGPAGLRFIQKVPLLQVEVKRGDDVVILGGVMDTTE